MEQIMVRVRDESKVDLLVNLLGSLDFVDEVRAFGEVKTHPESDNGVEDFFSLAGLWADRDVNIEVIRQRAWPRQ